MTFDSQAPGVRNDPRLLLLDPRDNVLTLVASVPAGTELTIAGQIVTLSTPLTLGHKLARRDLPRGTKVIKYGVSIGSTTADVRCGEHVHTHNLRSDYLPTFSHETQGDYFERNSGQG
jgi:hypothetical protein